MFGNEEEQTGTLVETRKIQFQNQIDFFRHPTVYDSLVNPTDTTPNVDNLDVLRLSGAVVLITNFLKGYENQYLRLLGDGTSTIQNNVNIKTNTGANKLLLANRVYKFSYINKIWYEDA